MRHEVAARRLGRLAVVERVAAVFDEGTFESAGAAGTEDDDGFHAVVGLVHARPVLVLATDFRFSRGTLSGRICATAVRAMARAPNMPIILLLDSDGVRLEDGEAAVGGVATLLAALADVSGHVPTIAVVCAIASGAAAYAAALADITIAVDRRSFAFVAGPAVVGAALGQQPGLDALGGTRLHAEHSGFVHALARDDGAAIRAARAVLAYLPSSAAALPARDDAWSAPAEQDVAAVLPAERTRAYDIQHVITRVVDQDSYLPLGASYGPAVQTGLARLAGRPVALCASQPRAMAGAIDANAAQKLARFVRFAAAFNLPVVTLADTPGFLPGASSERARILVHGAKVISAYTEARRSVPLLAVVLRRAVGGGGVMALGAHALFGLPGCEVVGMGTNAAQALTSAQGEASLGSLRGDYGMLSIIAGADVRRSLVDALARAHPPLPAPEGARKCSLVPL